MVVGASSGLGARSAQVLARAGAAVGIAARRRDRLDDVAESIHADGMPCIAVEADVTADGDVDRAFDAVEAQLGPVSIVVYASGVSPLGRAEKHTRKKWDDAPAVNLTGAFEVSQCAGQRMIVRGEGGSIIHIGSVIGLGASPVHRSVGYASTKGGLVNLTRQLAVEWTRHSIRVNAILPGYFATELTVDPRHGDIEPDQKARIEGFTPMGRIGRIEEIDTAVAFLAAPASSYVTGALIPVDGGWTAW
jgi:NAD(P)-dependent dehydrogenase (short-subunit alcohol dehydrogenase family)